MTHSLDNVNSGAKSNCESMEHDNDEDIQILNDEFDFLGDPESEPMPALESDELHMLSDTESESGYNDDNPGEDRDYDDYGDEDQQEPNVGIIVGSPGDEEFIDRLLAEALAHRQTASEDKRFWIREELLQRIPKFGVPKKYLTTHERIDSLETEISLWEQIEREGLPPKEPARNISKAHRTMDIESWPEPSKIPRADAVGRTHTETTPKMGVQTGPKTEGNIKPNPNKSLSRSDGVRPGRVIPQGFSQTVRNTDVPDNTLEPKSEHKKQPDEGTNGGTPGEIQQGIRTCKNCARCSRCWSDVHGDKGLLDDEHHTTLVEVNITCKGGTYFQTTCKPITVINFSLTVNNRLPGNHKKGPPKEFDDREAYWRSSVYYDRVRKEAIEKLNTIFPFNIFHEIGLDYDAQVKTYTYNDGTHADNIVLPQRDVYKQEEVMSKLPQPGHFYGKYKDGAFTPSYDSVLGLDMSCWYSTVMLKKRQVNYTDDLFAQRLKNITNQTNEDESALNRLAKLLFAVDEFEKAGGNTMDPNKVYTEKPPRYLFSGIGTYPMPVKVNKSKLDHSSRPKTEAPRNLETKVEQTPEKSILKQSSMACPERPTKKRPGSPAPRGYILGYGVNAYPTYNLRRSDTMMMKQSGGRNLTSASSRITAPRTRSLSERQYEDPWARSNYYDQTIETDPRYVKKHLPIKTRLGPRPTSDPILIPKKRTSEMQEAPHFRMRRIL
jgi:hypothetical protein